MLTDNLPNLGHVTILLNNQNQNEASTLFNEAHILYHYVKTLFSKVIVLVKQDEKLKTKYSLFQSVNCVVDK